MSRYSTNATRDDSQRLSTVGEDDSQYEFLTIGYKATPTPKSRDYSTATATTGGTTTRGDPKQIITDPSKVGTIRIGTTVSKSEAERDLAEQWRVSLAAKSRTDSGRLSKIGWEK
jgi:hypothetical protein